MVYKTSEYLIWQMIKQRCLNPKNNRYSFYGGRGIKICDEWLTNFGQFLSDMGLRPSLKYSIERIDNDGNYSKENCRWATQKEQCNNRRSTQLLYLNGKKVTMTELVEMSGISQATLWGRINRIGMSTESAILKPIHPKKKLTYNGVKITNLSKLSKELNIPLSTIYSRLYKNNFNLDDAIKGKQQQTWKKK